MLWKKHLNLDSILIKSKQSLSIKPLGGNNFKRQAKKVVKIHKKIRNQRNDFLNKLSSKIIDENQVIVLEDLKIRDMPKNRKLSKLISDVLWSEFVRMLKYKAAWYGRMIIKIGAFYPSSQVCSECFFNRDKYNKKAKLQHNN